MYIVLLQTIGVNGIGLEKASQVACRAGETQNDSHKGSLTGEGARYVIDGIGRVENIIALVKLRLRDISEDRGIGVGRWIRPRRRESLVSCLLERIITRQIAELKN